MATYKQGCISIVTGSDSVEGIGTKWLNYVSVGDHLTLGGVEYEILEIQDNDSLKITPPYVGDTLDRAPYVIQKQPVVKTAIDYAINAATLIDELLAKLDEDHLSYAGSLWQVNPKSRENVTGKIAEIQSKQILGQTIAVSDLFWKDVSNFIHTWSNVSDYLNWLHGFIAAYGTRRTALYKVAFDHKIALQEIVESLSMSEEEKILAILNYDYTSGWQSASTP